MLHVLLPSRFWKVPAGHLAHDSALAASPNVPGAHGVGSSLPTLQNVPTGQTTQSSALVIVIDVFMCVPPGQGSEAAAPSAQYAPSSHGLQLVWPSMFWNSPAGHLAHSEALAFAA